MVEKAWTSYQSPYKGFNRKHVPKRTLIVCACINPPIRGSIDRDILNLLTDVSYQSPYKGFNSIELFEAILPYIRYQSPYKGFNRQILFKEEKITKYQSPYKGFNSLLTASTFEDARLCINPPIRGSIVRRHNLVPICKRLRMVSIPL